MGGDRGAPAPRGVATWILLWTLGAAYFALEEASWGQWLFGWDSPELFQELNSKQETNLHNMSSWFNRKPRIALECWIMGLGVLLPLWRLLRGSPSFPPGDWRSWVVPSRLCLVSGLLFLAVRTGRWFRHETLGHQELKEYFTAVFITVYLMTCFAKVLSVAERSVEASRAPGTVRAERGLESGARREPGAESS